MKRSFVLVLEKACRNCGVVKPRDAFHRRDDTRDGLLSECKDCRRAYDRQWRADNKERCREYERQRGARRRSYRPNPL